MTDSTYPPDQIERNRALVRHVPAWIAYRGLRQTDIAEHLGTSDATVSRWLSGVQVMSLSRLEALAVILGATAAQLLLPPEDADRAEKYVRAEAILRALPDTAVESWLAVGEQMKPSV